MEITEIRIFQKVGQDKKLKAYTTVTFDNAFVVRNIKVIQGSNGLFIAMPSRKTKISCSNCSVKSEVGGKYCSGCGNALESRAHQNGEPSDSKSDHRDIAHPITRKFREYLQSEILSVYTKEISDQLAVDASVYASEIQISDEIE